MDQRGLVFIVLFILCGCFAARAQDSVDSLTWMTGCWELNVPQRQMTIAEHWMRPAGGTLIGMSRTVRGGKTTGFEYIRVETTASGIDYVAKPSSNKDETRFKLVKSSATEAVFENLAHDFPQRISYRLKAGGQLVAAIEGTKNGKTRRMEFNYERTKP